jgi:hypothetical protein
MILGDKPSFLGGFVTFRDLGSCVGDIDSGSTLEPLRMDSSRSPRDSVTGEPRCFLLLGLGAKFGCHSGEQGAMDCGAPVCLQ